MIFPLLGDPEGYQPHTIDMVGDAKARDYWLAVFEHQATKLEDLAAASEGGGPEARRRAEAAVARFRQILADIRRDPASHGPLSILLLCGLREECLRAEGIADAYRHIKRDENEAALALLPALLGELDAMEDAGDEQALLLTLIRNIFAGNLFDLGCKGTIELYEQGEVDFHATRARLPERPWLVDDFDALADRFADGAHREAVVFVDNAGADIVLGMIPLVRHLLRRGAAVVMTANSAPALNDITHPELAALMERIAAIDAPIADALTAGRLTLVPSGCGTPVIDLRTVSAELAEAAKGADLVVIEGMGQALETNYHARFACDALKVAMVKEQDVADLLGGRLYDVVCRFEPGD